jgi:hypothetical protein
MHFVYIRPKICWIVETPLAVVNCSIWIKAGKNILFLDVFVQRSNFSTQITNSWHVISDIFLIFIEINVLPSNIETDSVFTLIVCWIMFLKPFAVCSLIAAALMTRRNSFLMVVRCDMLSWICVATNRNNP